MEIFWRIFDTLILAGGFVYIFIKYGIPFFDNRKKGIELSLKKAAEYEKEAEKLYEQAMDVLKDVKSEVENIKKEAIKETETERDNIIKDAEAAAEKILGNYINQAKSEIDKQKKQLFDEALNMSFKFMRDIMQREMTPEVYGRINDNFLKLQEEAFDRRSNK